MAEPIELITAEEYARRMGVSRSTVFDWIARRYLVAGRHYLKVGKTLRFIWSMEVLASLTGGHPVEVEQSDEEGRRIRKQAINLEF